MINGERGLPCVAVLALKAISAEDVLPRQLDLLERHAQVGTQPDHTRIRIGTTHTSHCQRRASFYEFGFHKEEEKESLLSAAYANWLIRLVEHQYFRAQRGVPVRGWTAR